MKPFFQIFLLCLLPLTGSSLSFFQKQLSDEELKEKIAAEMSLDEKIGQLFMLGYPEANPDDFILEEIRSGRVGNVKIFGWNATDTGVVAEAVAKMQKAAAETRFEIPLFTATDQEGGWIRHVKGNTSVTPGNNAIGATGKLFDAYESGRLIAAELRVIGINMNFAPVVDLFDNPEADLIGPRTFSSDPHETAALAIAFFHGQEASRVLSTAKHFPGHGRTGLDSHIYMPRIRVSEEELKQHELIPFSFLVKEKIPAIMSGHLNFPEVTGENVSASLSPHALKDLLRDEMGFKGLVITDDLLMGGAQKPGVGYPNIPAECIRAGNDIVLISKDYRYYRDAFKVIRELCLKDAEFMNEVERAVRRVLTAKIEYLRNDDRVPLYPTKANAEELPLEESTAYQQSLALRAVTAAAPIKTIEKTTPLLLAGSYRNFSRAGSEIFTDSRFFFIRDFSRGTNQYEIADEITALAEAENRIVVLLVSDTETAAVGRVLNRREVPCILFSSLNPYRARDILLPEQSILYLYGVGFESFKAGFSALVGDFVPQGHLPIQ